MTLTWGGITLGRPNRIAVAISRLRLTQCLAFRIVLHNRAIRAGGAKADSVYRLVEWTGNVLELGLWGSDNRYESESSQDLRNSRNVHRHAYGGQLLRHCFDGATGDSGQVLSQHT